MRTSDPAEGVVAIRNGLGRSRGIRRRVDLVALDERPGPRDRRGRPVREGVGGLLSAKYIRDGTAPGGVVRILIGRDRIRLLVAHPKEVLTERAIRVLIHPEWRCDPLLTSISTSIPSQGGETTASFSSGWRCDPHLPCTSMSHCLAHVPQSARQQLQRSEPSAILHLRRPHDAELLPPTFSDKRMGHGRRLRLLFREAPHP